MNQVKIHAPYYTAIGYGLVEITGRNRYRCAMALIAAAGELGIEVESIHHYPGLAKVTISVASEDAKRFQALVTLAQS